ncbi:MAG TPA: HAD-IA family hydrolase [Candidatus Dormibacteraeota bacterium]|nr:HAD-IA family hydrolase [Candidatus Dormibacteraeota bacterium]
MKTVIFDFDGTLVDSLATIVDIFEQVNRKGSQLSNKEIAELRHLPLLAVAKRLGIPAWRVPFMLFSGRRMMGRRISELEPFKGLVAVIRQLHADGYNLLIVSSNSSRNVRAFLKQRKLDRYFSRVYGNVGLFDKAAALRKLISSNRLEISDCIYVGDETRDIEACEAINLRCVAVAWGFANPAFLLKHLPFALVQSPAELVQTIERAL